MNATRAARGTRSRSHGDAQRAPMPVTAGVTTATATAMTNTITITTTTTQTTKTKTTNPSMTTMKPTTTPTTTTPRTAVKAMLKAIYKSTTLHADHPSPSAFNLSHRTLCTAESLFAHACQCERRPMHSSRAGARTRNAYPARRCYNVRGSSIAIARTISRAMAATAATSTRV